MNPALRVMRILWAALLSSMGCIIVVSRVMVPPPDAVPQPVMLIGIAVAALASIVMSFVMPMIGFRQAARRARVATMDEPSPGGMPQGLFQGVGAGRKQPLNPTDARALAYRLYHTPLILSLALSESVGLYGLVIHAVGFADQFAIPFFVLSVILIAIRFPTEQRVLAAFEAATGIQIPPSGTPL